MDIINQSMKLWQILEQYHNNDKSINDKDMIWIFLNYKGSNKMAYNIKSPSITTDWIDINHIGQLTDHLSQICNATKIHSLAVRLNNENEETLPLLKRLDI